MPDAARAKPHTGSLGFSGPGCYCRHLFLSSFPSLLRFLLRFCIAMFHFCCCSASPRHRRPPHAREPHRRPARRHPTTRPACSELRPLAVAACETDLDPDPAHHLRPRRPLTVRRALLRCPLYPTWTNNSTPLASPSAPALSGGDRHLSAHETFNHAGRCCMRCTCGSLILDCPPPQA